MIYEIGCHFLRIYACTGLAGARYIQILYIRKKIYIYISKVISVPPRLSITRKYFETNKKF